MINDTSSHDVVRDSRTTFVRDAGDLRKYRTETPNLIDDLGLDPYEYRLYGHIKRVCGDEGVCWQGIRGMAKHCKMSVGSASEAKQGLLDRGLIEVEQGDGKKGEADTITVADIWLENFQHFAQKTPVHNTNTPVHTRSSDEHPRSQYERKKEPLEESKERRSNERPKKAALSGSEPSSPQKVKSLTDTQAQKLWDDLVENDPCGDELNRLAELAAGENKSGAKSITAVWNQIGRKYLKAKESKDYSEDAWRYGFEQAISRSKGGMEYVIACANGYRGEQSAKPRRSLAVVGAKESDYEADPFDYEGANRA